MNEQEENCGLMCPQDGNRCIRIKGHEGPHNCGVGEWEYEAESVDEVDMLVMLQVFEEMLQAARQNFHDPSTVCSLGRVSKGTALIASYLADDPKQQMIGQGHMQEMRKETVQ